MFGDIYPCRRNVFFISYTIFTDTSYQSRTIVLDRRLRHRSKQSIVFRIISESKQATSICCRSFLIYSWYYWLDFQQTQKRDETVIFSASCFVYEVNTAIIQLRPYAYGFNSSIAIGVQARTLNKLTEGFFLIPQRYQIWECSVVSLRISLFVALLF